MIVVEFYSFSIQLVVSTCQIKMDHHYVHCAHVKEKCLVDATLPA